MDAGVRRETCDSIGECHGRPIDQIGALRKADGPPGSPVHRNRVNRVRDADRLGRLQRIEMTAPKRGPPTSDRHEREVDGCNFFEWDVRTRVTGIPAPVVTLDQISERGPAMRASSMSSTVVIGGEDVYPKTAELDDVAGLDLGERYALGGDWLEQPPRARRDDENRGDRNQTQRRQVSVVGVQVRDQYEICMRSLQRRHWTAYPTEMAQASGQNRVEEDSGVTVLPGAGAVPPPCRCGRHGMPVKDWTCQRGLWCDLASVGCMIELEPVAAEGR